MSAAAPQGRTVKSLTVDFSPVLLYFSGFVVVLAWVLACGFRHTVQKKPNSVYIGDAANVIKDSGEILAEFEHLVRKSKRPFVMGSSPSRMAPSREEGVWGQTDALEVSKC